MSIRAERKATGRRPKVGNGEQRPRCDGGKVECSASGAERRGSLLFKIAINKCRDTACRVRSQSPSYLSKRRAVSATHTKKTTRFCQGQASDKIEKIYAHKFR